MCVNDIISPARVRYSRVLVVDIYERQSRKHIIISHVPHSTEGVGGCWTTSRGTLANRNRLRQYPFSGSLLAIITILLRGSLLDGGRTRKLPNTADPQAALCSWCSSVVCPTNDSTNKLTNNRNKNHVELLSSLTVELE